MLKTLPLCLELLIMDYKKQLDDFDKQVVKKTKKCKKKIKKSVKKISRNVNNDKIWFDYKKIKSLFIIDYQGVLFFSNFCNDCGNYKKLFIKKKTKPLLIDKIKCNCK